MERSAACRKHHAERGVSAGAVPCAALRCCWSHLPLELVWFVGYIRAPEPRSRSLDVPAQQARSVDCAGRGAKGRPRRRGRGDEGRRGRGEEAMPALPSSKRRPAVQQTLAGRAAAYIAPYTESLQPLRAPRLPAFRRDKAHSLRCSGPELCRFGSGDVKVTTSGRACWVPR